MTGPGTNTYLVGSGRDIAVLDPGPDAPSHLEAILAALDPGERIAHILVTHAHLDHSALAPALAAATGAPIAAFGAATDGRSAIMQDLAARGLSAGGEGLDLGFAPDIRLRDGDTIAGLTAVRTPGHAATHLCFAFGDVVFSGDTVMCWASTFVSPPDGDLTAFMATLDRLAGLNADRFLPGHGAAIAQPAARCHWLRDHRRNRETQILAAIGVAGRTAAQIATAVYRETPPALLPAAERNVFAHLIDLSLQDRLRPVPRLASDATFFHP